MARIRERDCHNFTCLIDSTPKISKLKTVSILEVVLIVCQGFFYQFTQTFPKTIPHPLIPVPVPFFSGACGQSCDTISTEHPLAHRFWGDSLLAGDALH
jgi:hypothetical protein